MSWSANYRIYTMYHDIFLTDNTEAVEPPTLKFQNKVRLNDLLRLSNLIEYNLQQKSTSDCNDCSQIDVKGCTILMRWLSEVTLTRHPA